MSNPARPTAKRHHTVPQFYLRGFAKDEQVATVGLPGDRSFLQSVGNATVANNFYALEGHQEGSDVIEKALAEIETATAAIFRKITAGLWPLDVEDRMTLGQFIALQAARVPSQRRTMDYLGAQMLRLQIGAGGKAALRAKLEKQAGGVVSDEHLETVWELATQPEGPPITRPRVESIQRMLDLSDELLKYIVGRPWTLVRFERRSLLTSDSPVGLIADPDDDLEQGVGFMTAWGITFPLSRKLGLLMSSVEPLIDLKVPVETAHQGNVDMTQAGTTTMEKFFNGHTVLNGSEWIFHHPDDAVYIPTELPDPRRVMVEMAGLPAEFTGEPWFGASGKD